MSEIETVHSFTTVPMVFSFPSSRLYIDLPAMTSADPTQYIAEKYDCYAYIRGEKYEVKECIRVGISFLDTNTLSSIISSCYTLPMGNLYIPDVTMKDFWTNNEIGNTKTINCYEFKYADEVFTILNCNPRDVLITPSTDNQCYQIHVSFEYEEVLNYVNSKYDTSYSTGEEISCYILLVVNYFYGTLISAGTKIS